MGDPDGRTVDPINRVLQVLTATIFVITIRDDRISNGGALPCTDHAEASS